jgi:prevent-host-death family protein
MKINILDAKNKLSQLVRRVQAGEEVTIANRGEPVARLVPIEPSPGQAASETLADWLACNPLPRHLQRSAAAIDAEILSERSSWD